MKVAVVYESRTGHTAELAELIGAAAQELGHEVGVFPTGKINLDYLGDADMVFLGSWCHGIFVLGQHPGDGGKLLAMPGVWGKPVAGFISYLLAPGKVLDKMADVAEILGGEWIGGRNFKQTNKTDGLAGFVVAALDAAEERLGAPAET